MSKINYKHRILRKALPFAIIIALTLTIGIFSIKRIIKYFLWSNGDKDDQDNASSASSVSSASSPPETSLESSWESLSEIDRNEQRKMLSDIDDFEPL